jgi:hypothetical protein
MRFPTRTEALAGIVLAGMLVGGAPRWTRAATVEITDDPSNAPIAIANVSRRGTAVVGTLTNRSADEIHDIRLLIDIPFLWANEVKPGEESPGRASVLTV